MEREVKRGEVYYIKYDPAEMKAPHEQGGTRPAVIIQNNTGNYYSPTVIVAFLTAKRKKPMPTHVRTCTTPRPSTILCEQIATISKERLQEYICCFSESEMDEVDSALSISLGLQN